MIDPRAAIDDWAKVDHTVTIAAGTKVWQFASVIRGAMIGMNCNIGAGAVIDGAIIGDDCKIGANAFIPPGVMIGRNVFVGPCAVFCNDQWPEVATNGFDISILQRGEPCTIVHDYAAIGANSTILPGFVIGEQAIVAAGAELRSNVPAECAYRVDGSIVFESIERRRLMRMRLACQFEAAG